MLLVSAMMLQTIFRKMHGLYYSLLYKTRISSSLKKGVNR